MTALTADRNAPSRAGIAYSMPSLASVKTFVGALVCVDANGWAKPGVTATGLTSVGRCTKLADNSSGANGAINIEFESGTFLWANGSALTKANIGDTVYIDDDQTVHGTAAGRSVAGVMVDIDANGVWVETNVATVGSSVGLLAANNLSDVSNAATSRSNLALDTGDSPTFTGLTATGNLSVTGTSTLTGDATLAGGAGGLTMVAAGSSLVCLDNSATGWVAGSSGNPNMLQLNTLTGLEKVVIEGTTTQVALHCDIGTFLCDESATITGGHIHAATEALHKTAKITLTATQIKAAATSPFTLVAAVANKMMIFKGAALKFNAGAEILVEPSAPDDFAIRYTDGSGDIVGDTGDSGILFATAGPADAYAEMHPIPVVPGVLADRVNTPLVLDNTGTDLTGNASDDATLDVYISYIEVDMS